ncbi:LOW QUALITY PROTEIN: large ribosomal subunit protein uL10m [Ascaphus truei]|uniref:LOW QUALITY PROTEIN: large ribosomal subunit protein uL10m n=1 Tax=Ascaphus truei TaxID=8439 RepID=UPI003F5908E1
MCPLYLCPVIMRPPISVPGWLPGVRPPLSGRLPAVRPPLSGWLPAVQWVRHGSKAVTRHRKASHFEKQKLMALTQYIAPETHGPREKCRPRDKTQPGGGRAPLERLLCSQLDAVLRDCKMVAVFQRNAARADDLLRLRTRLLKHEIHIKHTFPTQVVRQCVTRSPHRSLLPLFMGQTLLVVSHPVKVREMLQGVRILPQIQLLGASVDGSVLSRQGVQSYARLQSREVLLGQLLGALTMMTSHTCALLAQHPARTSALLEQHIREQSAEQHSQAQ